ncbi:hypothetical protein ADUPG1_007992, partial [Aduncisulcus paluster]
TWNLFISTMSNVVVNLIVKSYPSPQKLIMDILTSFVVGCNPKECPSQLLKGKIPCVMPFGLVLLQNLREQIMLRYFMNRDLVMPFEIGMFLVDSELYLVPTADYSHPPPFPSSSSFTDVEITFVSSLKTTKIPSHITASCRSLSRRFDMINEACDKSELTSYLLKDLINGKYHMVASFLSVYLTMIDQSFISAEKVKKILNEFIDQRFTKKSHPVAEQYVMKAFFSYSCERMFVDPLIWEKNITSSTSSMSRLWADYDHEDVDDCVKYHSLAGVFTTLNRFQYYQIDPFECANELNSSASDKEDFFSRMQHVAECDVQIHQTGKKSIKKVKPKHSIPLLCSLLCLGYKPKFEKGRKNGIQPKYCPYISLNKKEYHRRHVDHFYLSAFSSSRHSNPLKVPYYQMPLMYSQLQKCSSHVAPWSCLCFVIQLYVGLLFLNSRPNLDSDKSDPMIFQSNRGLHSAINSSFGRAQTHSTSLNDAALVVASSFLPIVDHYISSSVLGITFNKTSNPFIFQTLRLCSTVLDVFPSNLLRSPISHTILSKIDGYSRFYEEKMFNKMLIVPSFMSCVIMHQGIESAQNQFARSYGGQTQSLERMKDTLSCLLTPSFLWRIINHHIFPKFIDTASQNYSNPLHEDVIAFKTSVLSFLMPSDISKVMWILDPLFAPYSGASILFQELFIKKLYPHLTRENGKVIVDRISAGIWDPYVSNMFLTHYPQIFDIETLYSLGKSGLFDPFVILSGMFSIYSISKCTTLLMNAIIVYYSPTRAEVPLFDCYAVQLWEQIVCFKFHFGYKKSYISDDCAMPLLLLSYLHHWTSLSDKEPDQIIDPLIQDECNWNNMIPPHVIVALSSQTMIEKSRILVVNQYLRYILTKAVLSQDINENDLICLESLLIWQQTKPNAIPSTMANLQNKTIRMILSLFRDGVSQNPASAMHHEDSVKYVRFTRRLLMNRILSIFTDESEISTRLVKTCMTHLVHSCTYGVLSDINPQSQNYSELSNSFQSFVTSKVPAVVVYDTIEDFKSKRDLFEMWFSLYLLFVCCHTDAGKQISIESTGTNQPYLALFEQEKFFSLWTHNVLESSSLSQSVILFLDTIERKFLVSSPSIQVREEGEDSVSISPFGAHLFSEIYADILFKSGIHGLQSASILSVMFSAFHEHLQIYPEFLNIFNSGGIMGFLMDSQYSSMLKDLICAYMRIGRTQKRCMGSPNSEDWSKSDTGGSWDEIHHHLMNPVLNKLWRHFHTSFMLIHRSSKYITTNNPQYFSSPLNMMLCSTRHCLMIEPTNGCQREIPLLFFRNLLDVVLFQTIHKKYKCNVYASASWNVPLFDWKHAGGFIHFGPLYYIITMFVFPLFSGRKRRIISGIDELMYIWWTGRSLMFESEMAKSVEKRIAYDMANIGNPHPDSHENEAISAIHPADSLLFAISNIRSIPQMVPHIFLFCCSINRNQIDEKSLIILNSLVPLMFTLPRELTAVITTLLIRFETELKSFPWNFISLLQETKALMAKKEFSGGKIPKELISEVILAVKKNISSLLKAFGSSWSLFPSHCCCQFIASMNTNTSFDIVTFGQYLILMIYKFEEKFDQSKLDNSYYILDFLRNPLSAYGNYTRGCRILPTFASYSHFIIDNFEDTHQITVNIDAKFFPRSIYRNMEIIRAIYCLSKRTLFAPDSKLSIVDRDGSYFQCIYNPVIERRPLFSENENISPELSYLNPFFLIIENNMSTIGSSDSSSGSVEEYMYYINTLFRGNDILIISLSLLIGIIHSFQTPEILKIVKREGMIGALNANRQIRELLRLSLKVILDENLKYKYSDLFWNSSDKSSFENILRLLSDPVVCFLSRHVYALIEKEDFTKYSTGRGIFIGRLKYCLRFIHNVGLSEHSFSPVLRSIWNEFFRYYSKYNFILTDCKDPSMLVPNLYRFYTLEQMLTNESCWNFLEMLYYFNFQKHCIPKLQAIKDRKKIWDKELVSQFALMLDWCKASKTDELFSFLESVKADISKGIYMWKHCKFDRIPSFKESEDLYVKFRDNKKQYQGALKLFFDIGLFRISELKDPLIQTRIHTLNSIVTSLTGSSFVDDPLCVIKFDKTTNMYLLLDSLRNFSNSNSNLNSLVFLNDLHRCGSKKLFFIQSFVNDTCPVALDSFVDDIMQESIDQPFPWERFGEVIKAIPEEFKFDKKTVHLSTQNVLDLISYSRQTDAVFLCAMYMKCILWELSHLINEGLCHSPADVSEDNHDPDYFISTSFKTIISSVNFFQSFEGSVAEYYGKKLNIFNSQVKHIVQNILTRHLNDPNYLLSMVQLWSGNFKQCTDSIVSIGCQIPYISLMKCFSLNFHGYAALKFCLEHTLLRVFNGDSSTSLQERNMLCDLNREKEYISREYGFDVWRVIFESSTIPHVVERLSAEIAKVQEPIEKYVLIEKLGYMYPFISNINDVSNRPIVDFLLFCKCWKYVAHMYRDATIENLFTLIIVEKDRKHESDEAKSNNPQQIQEQIDSVDTVHAKLSSDFPYLSRYGSLSIFIALAIQHNLTIPSALSDYLLPQFPLSSFSLPDASFAFLNTFSFPFNSLPFISAVFSSHPSLSTMYRVEVYLSGVFIIPLNWSIVKRILHYTHQKPLKGPIECIPSEGQSAISQRQGIIIHSLNEAKTRSSKQYLKKGSGWATKKRRGEDKRDEFVKSNPFQKKGPTYYSPNIIPAQRLVSRFFLLHALQEKNILCVFSSKAYFWKNYVSSFSLAPASDSKSSEIMPSPLSSSVDSENPENTQDRGESEEMVKVQIRFRSIFSHIPSIIHNLPESQAQIHLPFPLYEYPEEMVSKYPEALPTGSKPIPCVLCVSPVGALATIRHSSTSYSPLDIFVSILNNFMVPREDLAISRAMLSDPIRSSSCRSRRSLYPDAVMIRKPLVAISLTDIHPQLKLYSLLTPAFVRSIEVGERIFRHIPSRLSSRVKFEDCLDLGILRAIKTRNKIHSSVSFEGMIAQDAGGVFREFVGRVIEGGLSRICEENCGVFTFIDDNSRSCTYPLNDRLTIAFTMGVYTAVTWKMSHKFSFPMCSFLVMSLRYMLRAITFCEHKRLKDFKFLEHIKNLDPPTKIVHDFVEFAPYSFDPSCKGMAHFVRSHQEAKQMGMEWPDSLRQNNTDHITPISTEIEDMHDYKTFIMYNLCRKILKAPKTICAFALGFATSLPISSAFLDIPNPKFILALKPSIEVLRADIIRLVRNPNRVPLMEMFEDHVFTLTLEKAIEFVEKFFRFGSSAPRMKLTIDDKLQEHHKLPTASTCSGYIHVHPDWDPKTMFEKFQSVFKLGAHITFGFV